MLRSWRQRGPPQRIPTVPALDRGGGLDAGPGGAASDTGVFNGMEIHGAFWLSRSIPTSHQCQQQAGEDVRAVRAIPSQAGGGSSLGCWPGVPLSQLSFPERFLEANVVRDLAAMLLASVRRYADVFNRLPRCRGQTSVDASRLAAEGMVCTASGCLESQPRANVVPQEVTSAISPPPRAGPVPCYVPANLHPPPVMLYLLA